MKWEPDREGGGTDCTNLIESIQFSFAEIQTELAIFALICIILLPKFCQNEKSLK